MESTENLFGFEQIEVDSGVVTPHRFLKRLIRNLKSTYWTKVPTPIQQTVFLIF